MLNGPPNQVSARSGALLSLEDVGSPNCAPAGVKLEGEEARRQGKHCCSPGGLRHRDRKDRVGARGQAGERWVFHGDRGSARREGWALGRRAVMAAQQCERA